MASAKVPASIANASKEELERLLIETLKKLKIRDKKLEVRSAINVCTQVHCFVTHACVRLKCHTS